MPQRSGAATDDPVLSLYAVIEESALMLGVRHSRERVLAILSAYRDGLADAPVAFRVATGARNAGELDCRFSVTETDPYQVAVANGFVVPTGRPVDALFADIRERCPVSSCGIDFGVASGFKKVWLMLPPGEFQQLPVLAGIPSMPPSLGGNLDFLTRHHLGGGVGLLGIDYQRRSVNVYFGAQSAACFEPANIRSMLREAGQAGPTDRMLALGRQAFGIYASLNWDSPAPERICLAVVTQDPTRLPVPLDPEIDRFVRHVQRSGGEQKFVYAISSSADGEYCKLQSYYRWRPIIREFMQLADPPL